MPATAVRPHAALKVLGTALLAGALVVYFLSVLRIDLYESRFLDMDPHPDADEYMAGAISLATEGTFRIHNAGRMVPPRYPFGFSLGMVPLLWLGLDPVTVPIRFNQLVGLLLILVPFALFWRAGDPLGGGLTSLFMATLPGVPTLARSPMSDLVGAAVIVAAYYCFWRFVRSSPGTLRWGVAGSMVLGLGLWVRTPNLMYVGLLAIAGFFGQQVPFTRRIRTVVLLSLAFAVAITPVLLYNYVSFDHPLKTGYDYWMPRQDGSLQTSPSTAFAGRRVFYQGNSLWDEIVQHERGMNIARIFGTGSYLNPTLILIGLVGAITALLSRDRAPVVIGCAAAVAFLPVLVLRTADVRNWFVFPLLLPFVAGRQMSGLLRHAAGGPRRDWISLTAVVLLCAAAVTGWPGHNARFETTELLNVRRFRGYAPRHDGVKHLARLTREHPALVLTNFNTSYVYALTEGDRIVSPFHPINMPTFNKDWFPDTARRAQVREALATRRTVYALLVRRPVERYLPPPAGYEWDEVWRGRGRSLAVLARLVKL